MIEALITYWPLAAYGLAVIAVYVRFGWKAAFAVATLGAGALIYRAGRKDGQKIEQAATAEKERQDVQAVTKIRTEVKSKSDAELDEEVDTWTRKD